jgi:cyclase
MLKKRLIFTLLYNHGQFMLSRNFRLQNVGDINWLQANYNFTRISFSIDELIVLDVSRGKRDAQDFYAVLKELALGCFAPIAAGGGITTVNHARELLRSGADKVVVNTSLYNNNDFIKELASEFGEQCVVASMDIKRSNNGEYQLFSQNGSKCVSGSAKDWIKFVSDKTVGEIYLNSIDRDGTGQGYDMQILDLLCDNISKPIILAGGAGNALHLAEGLADSRINAVATANLFNFVGSGLKDARVKLNKIGHDLPDWNADLASQLKNILSS